MPSNISIKVNFAKISAAPDIKLHYLIMGNSLYFNLQAITDIFNIINKSVINDIDLTSPLYIKILDNSFNIIEAIHLKFKLNNLLNDEKKSDDIKSLINCFVSMIDSIYIKNASVLLKSVDIPVVIVSSDLSEPVNTEPVYLISEVYKKLIYEKIAIGSMSDYTSFLNELGWIHKRGNSEWLTTIPAIRHGYVAPDHSKIDVVSKITEETTTINKESARITEKGYKYLKMLAYKNKAVLMPLVVKNKEADLINN